MKKFITLILLVVIVISLKGCFNSCSGSRNKDRAKIEEYREQYIDACADGNFVEAHKILDKMRPLFIIDSDFEEHRSYVDEAEVSSLISDGSKDASNRILFLMSQAGYCGPNEQKVLSLAILQNNSFLALKLLKKGAEIYPSDAETAVSNDMSDVIEYMISKSESLVADEQVFDYLKENNNTSEIIVLLTKYAKTNPKEAIEFAASNGFDDLAKELIKTNFKTADGSKKSTLMILAITLKYNDMALSFIDQIPLKELVENTEISDFLKKVKGEKEFKAYEAKLRINELNEKLKSISKISLPSRPALGLVKGNHYSEMSDEHVAYRSAIHDYNEKCKNVMVEAAELGLKTIANKALGMMRPNIEWKELGDWARVVEHETDVYSVYNAYRVTENRNEINAARNLLNRYK